MPGFWNWPVGVQVQTPRLGRRPDCKGYCFSRYRPAKSGGQGSATGLSQEFSMGPMICSALHAVSCTAAIGSDVAFRSCCRRPIMHATWS